MGGEKKGKKVCRKRNGKGEKVGIASSPSSTGVRPGSGMGASARTEHKGIILFLLNHSLPKPIPMLRMHPYLPPVPPFPAPALCQRGYGGTGVLESFFDASREYAWLVTI